MSSETCGKCGGVLVIGQGDKDIDWCPKCEGLDIVSKEESKATLVEVLKVFDRKMKEIIKKYKLEDLLITVYVTRESVLHFDHPDYPSFMAYSSLLNEIVNSKSGGGQEVVWDSEDIQALYQYAKLYNQYSKFFQHLNSGLICFILVKNKDTTKYSYNFEKSIKAEGMRESPEEVNSDEFAPLMKFTAKWRPIRDNLKQYGLVSKNEAYFEEDYIFRYLEADDFWKSILTKVMLELWAGNPALLEFPEFKDSLKYLKVWEYISASFPFDQREKKDEMGRVVGFNMKPVDIVKVFYQFFKSDLELDYASKFFIDITSKVKRGFPAFLLTSKGLFVGQSTAILITRYLKGKYFRGYLDSKKNVGNEFVLMVATELERLGFFVRSLNNNDQLLINIVDDEKNPTLEIDLVAFTKDHIYLIECKHVLLSSEFDPDVRVNNVKRNLKDELPKMKTRVNYLSKHLKEFGIDHIKGGTIKPVFVTFNKEPLERFEDIEIVAFRELQSLDYSVKNESFLINDRGVKVYQDPFRHKLLKIPNVSERRLGNGVKYRVLSVGLTVNKVFQIPAVTIKDKNTTNYFRLPAQLLGWVLFCKNASDIGKNMFPSDVEFGYLVAENRYYAHIL